MVLGKGDIRVLVTPILTFPLQAGEGTFQLAWREPLLR